FFRCDFRIFFLLTEIQVKFQPRFGDFDRTILSTFSKSIHDFIFFTSRFSTRLLDQIIEHILRLLLAFIDAFAFTWGSHYFKACKRVLMRSTSSCAMVWRSGILATTWSGSLDRKASLPNFAPDYCSSFSALARSFSKRLRSASTSMASEVSKDT